MKPQKPTAELQPTQEPQTIGTLIGQVLDPLKSQFVAYETQAEAEEAWEKSKATKGSIEKLIAAGYPLRAVETLGNMYGPGLDAAKELSRQGHELLFLIGDRGPGKTQIATYLAQARIIDGRSCGFYRKALDLWGEIRASWRSDSKQSEAEVISKYRKTPFLVIDEAQERGDTDADRQWCDRTLAHLLDHRYDSRLATVIVANLSEQSFDATIPASVRSRASESGGVKLCDWASYRK